MNQILFRACSFVNYPQLSVKTEERMGLKARISQILQTFSGRRAMASSRHCCGLRASGMNPEILTFPTLRKANKKHKSSR